MVSRNRFFPSTPGTIFERNFGTLTRKIYNFRFEKKILGQVGFPSLKCMRIVYILRLAIVNLLSIYSEINVKKGQHL